MAQSIRYAPAETAGRRLQWFLSLLPGPVAATLGSKRIDLQRLWILGRNTGRAGRGRCRVSRSAHHVPRARLRQQQADLSDALGAISVIRRLSKRRQ